MFPYLNIFAEVRTNNAMLIFVVTVIILGLADGVQFLAGLTELIV